MRKRKKRPKPFRAVNAVKAKARETIGTPPATRRQPNVKKDLRQKHKPTLGQILRDLD